MKSSQAAAEKINEIDFNAHEFQATALQSKKRYTILHSGIQGGKSICGAFWLGCKIYEWPRANHLVGFPTYGQFEQSTWDAINRSGILRDRGTMNWQRYVFTLDTGGKIYFRSADRPTQIEGITDVRSVWLDEAGAIKYEAWINYEGRSSYRKAPILMTTTPYAMNWIYRDFIKKNREGAREDTLVIGFPSIANPTFDRTEYERQKRLLDPRIFSRRYGGEWVRMEGLVYDIHESESYVDPFTFPDGTRYFGGVDWGYSTSAFALTVRAVTQDGTHYLVSEFKKPGLKISDVCQIVKQKQQIYGVEMWCCDSSRPEMIEELNRWGCTAVGSTHEIVAGIEIHRSLINSRRYKILRGMAPHTEEEYSLYRYKEQRDERPIEETPLDMDNDLMDCERYVSWELRQMLSARSSKPRSTVGRAQEERLKMREDPAIRIKNLTKPPRKRKGYLNRGFHL